MCTCQFPDILNFKSAFFFLLSLTDIYAAGREKGALEEILDERGGVKHGERHRRGGE